MAFWVVDAGAIDQHHNYFNTVGLDSEGEYQSNSARSMSEKEEMLPPGILDMQERISTNQG